MLVRRKIKSVEGAPPLSGSLISGETQASYSQAIDVVDQAKAEARQLLEEAKEQRQEFLEKASLEVWERADAQFRRWEIEHQALCDNLEQYATSVANQAIYHLLEETLAPQRLAALIRQLMACHVPAIKASLACHPHDLEAIKQCLASRNSTHWLLRPDNALQPQTLILHTDEGDFHIDWEAMIHAFMENDKGR